MQRIRIVILAIIISTIAPSAFAQTHQQRVKQLEQHGIPYFYNEDIEANIEAWAKNDSGKTAAVLGRLNAYNPELEFAQKSNGLPWFIKYISAAITGADIRYVANDGSTGMWALNFTIAKKYGLKQNAIVDERKSILQSSEAACKYLKDLYGIYKDWLKTITAFKIGAVRLNQVIRLAGNSLDFNDIYKFLEPAEREPIAQFYAAAAVLYFKNDFKIIETPSLRIDSDTASANTEISYALIAEYTSITAQELSLLNPEFKVDYVPFFGGTTYFNVPKTKRENYMRMRDSIHKKIHFVPSPPLVLDSNVSIGDSLPILDSQSVRISVAQPVVPQPNDPKVWVWYKVKVGDGFYTLSDVFDCTIEEMKSWNRIYNNNLIANTAIKFLVPASKLEYYKKINGMNHAQKRNISQQD